MHLTPLLTVACLAGVLLAPPAAGGTRAAATCAGLPATIIGTPGADALTGTSGADVIAGLGGADTVDGLAGDDVLCGDDDGDRLVGGEGDDQLYGGDAPGFPDEGQVSDTLVPGPGDDLVDVGVNVRRASGYNKPDTIDWSGSTSGVTADLLAGTATGEGTDRLVLGQDASGLGAVVILVGSTHADTLLGSDSDDQLIGNGGGDHLVGRGGDDGLTTTPLAGAAATPPADDDLLEGGEGADHLDGDGGTDVLVGGPGGDHLRTWRGGGSLDGGAGRDLLDVRVGASGLTAVGGPGRDRVALEVLGAGRGTRGVVDHAREQFVVRRDGGPAVRSALVDVERVGMPAGRGSWTYLGTPGADTVTGRAAYTARGRGGDDELRGTRFDDVLLGGPGDDRVVGGGGTDLCRAESVRGCEFPE